MEIHWCWTVIQYIAGGSLTGQYAANYVQFDIATGTIEQAKKIDNTSVSSVNSISGDSSHIYIAGRYFHSTTNNAYGGMLLKYDLMGNEVWRNDVHPLIPSTQSIYLNDVFYDETRNYLIVTGGHSAWYTPDSIYQSYSSEIVLLDTMGKPFENIAVPESDYRFDYKGRVYITEDFYNQIPFSGSQPLVLNTYPVNARHQYYGRLVPWCTSLSWNNLLPDRINSCDYLVDLTADVTGTGLRYQWYEQGITQLNDVYHSQLGVLYTGTTEKNLYLSIQSAADSGLITRTYEVIVSDACGNIDTSNVTTLYHYIWPFEGNTSPSIVTVNEGQDTLLTTLYNRSVFPDSIVEWMWWKGQNFVLYDNSKYSGALTDTLNIFNIDIYDGGQYYMYPVLKYCPTRDLGPKSFYLDVESNIAIQKIGNNKDLKVFPNPVSDRQLNLNWLGRGVPDDYAVYSMDGQLVQSGVYGGSTQTTIPLNDLPTGTYILKVSANGENYIKAIEIIK